MAQYRQSFVIAVKEAYPNWVKMHQALDSASVQVGWMLEGKSHWDPDPQTVVEMLDRDHTDELRAEAYERACARRLFRMWNESAVE